MAEEKLDLARAGELACEAIRKAVPHAFATMAGVDAVLDVEADGQPVEQDLRCVAGVIGWVGSLSGTGMLECTPEFACTLANLMLGTEEKTLTPEALDAVAEMTNIIFGCMKTDLEPLVGPMALSVPTIISGTDVQMRTSGERIAVFRIGVDASRLRVRLYLNQMEERRGALGQYWTLSCEPAK
ncbi:chemotaxis protein CheX [Silvibacterium dinghuense]|uniref:Chemotaxis protein CheX n=1 Tax=Silvibacterium dinghuense TaxID=1560006 RepID=A0A4Q1SD72_9BACT|nr:chemotaxis protein CheX [Silvibacterium dinghuense]RXS94991.1 chemotaxis protein CheX [Silvibacterium dinghuense]GGH09661.1 chemotaxis protein CheX [Silvibacterium dinghuense]